VRVGVGVAACREEQLQAVSAELYSDGRGEKEEF